MLITVKSLAGLFFPTLFVARSTNRRRARLVVHRPLTNYRAREPGSSVEATLMRRGETLEGVREITGKQ